MIALHHIVKKGKRKEQYLLDHVNLNINKGEFLAITYSDTKSMIALLKILTFNDYDFYGEYYYENQIIKRKSTKNPAQYAKEIGLVINHLNLIDHLSVEENILLPLHQENIPLKRKEEMLFDLMDFLKISHLKSSYPADLNDYLRFKVAIAQSMVLKPKMLVISNVVEKLTPEEKGEFYDILVKLNSVGTTIVLAIPSAEEINLYHRVFHLHDGKLLLQTD